MIAHLFCFFFALPDRDIEPRSTILYRSYMAMVRLLVCFAISGIDTTPGGSKPPHWTAYYYVAVLPYIMSPYSPLYRSSLSLIIPHQFFPW